MKSKTQLTLRMDRINPQGKAPIVISVRVNGKRVWIPTGQFVDPNNWDKDNQVATKKEKGYLDINIAIEVAKSKVDKHLNLVKLTEKATTAGDVKVRFSGKGDWSDYFVFADDYIKRMKAANEWKPGTLRNYTKCLNRMKRYNGGSRKLSFEEVNEAFLQNVKEKMLAEGKGPNTIWDQFKLMRKFFNQAIIEKKVPHDLYPFKTTKYPKYKSVKKPHLTFAELDLWEKYAYQAEKGRQEAQASLYFLLGCYTGLRISDWKQFDYKLHVKKNGVMLTATKNDGEVYVPIHARLERLLRYIKDVKFDINEVVANRTLKEIAKTCEIKKVVSSHIGRHTFAVTICAQQGISSETCAKLMAIDISTCVDNYYKVNQEKIDQECAESWKLTHLKVA